jgi:hypothetical protein
MVLLVGIFYLLPLSLMAFQTIPETFGPMLSLIFTATFTILVISLERSKPALQLALVFAYGATLFSLLGNWMFNG